MDRVEARSTGIGRLPEAGSHAAIVTQLKDTFKH
jgi:hypothetical protein